MSENNREQQAYRHNPMFEEGVRLQERQRSRSGQGSGIQAQSEVSRSEVSYSQMSSNISRGRPGGGYGAGYSKLAQMKHEAKHRELLEKIEEEKQAEKVKMSKYK